MRSSADSPVMCGVAIEVPLKTLVAVSDAIPHEMTSTPGANTATFDLECT